jgi:hypothetical protein
LNDNVSMSEPSYPPARAVAARVEAHFAKHLAEARHEDRGPVAPEPDAATIEAVIDGAFWASLRREEGYIPRISLALVPPSEAGRPLTLKKPLPFTPAALTRMAPAVERPGIHLGVWRQGAELCVWGVTRVLPNVCFVLEVAAPGLLVIKHGRPEEEGKFLNVAVLEGDQVKVIDERAARLPDSPALLTSLLGFEPPSATPDSVAVMRQLAVSMRAHGRGGSLLVVPPDAETWRESIKPHIPYPVVPPFAEIAELLGADAEARQRHRWREAIREAVDAIAGLTAVDGATVVSHRYELMAFGAKITRRSGHPPCERILVAEPVEGAQPEVVNPTQLGGTRHQSAAQFAHDQRDAAALVASQDGRFTIFAWSTVDAMVHAYRVETLLL